MKTIIRNAILVNEGTSFKGALVIEDEIITQIIKEGEDMVPHGDVEIDATGCYLLPGVIDDHVHFRDPGLIHKADMVSESRAAAAGGVTSFMDMPNTTPQTTTLEALEAKFEDAKHKSHINYSFYLGATNTNADILASIDKNRVCGIKLFMGSSTGNMLVDRRQALEKIFAEAPIPIMVHTEDQSIISANTAIYQEKYGDDPDVKYHPMIRSEEACYQSSSEAVALAKESGARLHIAHISTARELDLLSSAPLSEKKITAEVCVSHLFFSEDDYEILGTRIKCNPAIKSKADRDALRKALTDGRVDVIGTDHAPHLLKEKEGGALKAVSGMPMIQFSLVAMLELVDSNVITLEQLVQKMCHAPAEIFEIDQRGYLREGYKADLVLVRRDIPWEVTPERIFSKCGWSPLEGHHFDWRVEQTFVNGQLVYKDGEVFDDVHGQEVRFTR